MERKYLLGNDPACFIKKLYINDKHFNVFPVFILKVLCKDSIFCLILLPLISLYGTSFQTKILQFT